MRKSCCTGEALKHPLLVYYPVEFTKKQDPHLLMTGIYDASFGVYNNMLISMSPDAYVTAVAMGRSIGIFNTENGNLEELLEEVHGGIGEIF